MGTEAEARSGLSPPAYSAVQHPPVYMPKQNRSRLAFRPRFWHLLACTFAALAAQYVIRKKYGLNPMYSLGRSVGVAGPDHCTDNARWEEAQDVPESYRFHSRTSVTLPMSADILSVIEAGERTHGSLEISQTGDVGPDATVEVDVFFRHQEDFEQATVCRLHPSRREWGLGIFTPARRSPPGGDPTHQLRFDVHLHLPAAPSLVVPHLKTDLHDFSQHLHALDDSVHFKKLALKSSNGRILAESVAGDTLELHTTNGDILGRFKTASELDLQSSNGRIEAKVSLLATPPSPSKCTFHVTAHTSNAALDVAFVDAPPSHTLAVSARTSNGRADVAMHESFEGSFDLQTTNAGTPAVHARVVAQDPSGQGRYRDYEYAVLEEGRNRVQGNVWWDWEARAKGSVVVSTSDAPLQLTV